MFIEQLSQRTDHFRMQRGERLVAQDGLDGP